MPFRIVPQSVSLVFVTTEPAQMIERAARTCYASEPVGDRARFLAALLLRGHLSVFEHASATFDITCDRGVSHELVRHRVASYSQQSTRFCDLASERFSNKIAVVEPPGLSPAERSLWLLAMKEATNAYAMLRKDGVKPEIARSVLPTCLATRIVTTMNLREWLWMLRLRTAKAAHPQMREVAFAILGLLREQVPEVFGPPVCFVPGSSETWTPPASQDE